MTLIDYLTECSASETPATLTPRQCAEVVAIVNHLRMALDGMVADPECGLDGRPCLRCQRDEANAENERLLSALTNLERCIVWHDQREEWVCLGRDRVGPAMISAREAIAAMRW